MQMSPEVSLLGEVWDSVKSHIPRKERLGVAETVVRLFDDHVDISDVDDHINEYDSVLKTAVVSHFDLLLEDDDEDEEDWEC
jgi:hypothetical protein